MRLPNGYGSIIYLGKGRRKPYAVRITTGYELYINKEGKERYRQKYAYLNYYETSKEAHIALCEYNANRTVGIEISKEPKRKAEFVPTFEKLYQEWYSRKEKSPKNFSRSTLKGYRNGFSKLKDYHNKPITFFTSVEIQKIMDSLSEYSLSYVMKISNVLNGVLDLAYKMKYIKANEIAMCEKMYTNKDKKMHRAFTKEEISMLWNHQEEDVAKMILITIYSGLRPAELVEIRKDNIFIEDNYFIEGIKTKAGKNRIVPMHRKIKSLFNYFIDKSNEGNIFLFPSRRKKDFHIDYGSYLKNFNEYLQEIGMEKHTPHDGRHTCSTLLAEARIPLLERQKILGHSSNNITDDVYVHLDIQILIDDINMI